MFELLIIFIIIAALSVILSKNIIQSVLYLILVFLLSSILFIYLGADFIGLIILIVYIGAISVLFLFIVMMLNIRLLEIYTTFQIYLPLAFILCIILLGQCIYLFIKNFNFIYFDNLLIYNN
jgi:NADH-quinone oxidoreductase subunit J